MDPPDDLIRKFQEHIPTLLAVATSLIGVEEAEDATQEALIRAWNARNTLRDHSALRPWLIRITTNICLQWRRSHLSQERLNERPLIDTLASSTDFPGSNDHMNALDIRIAINQLSPDLRIIVLLRYYANLDATEIGHSLNIPSATVRTRLRRAVAILRKHLHVHQQSVLQEATHNEA